MKLQTKNVIQFNHISDVLYKSVTYHQYELSTDNLVVRTQINIYMKDINAVYDTNEREMTKNHIKLWKSIRNCFNTILNI